MNGENIIRSTDNNGDHEEQDDAHKKSEMDAQSAIDETGFGKFNYKVAAVGGMIYMNLSFSIPNMGFILSSAACDYNMDTIAMNHLGTAQLLGMIFGSFLWGCIANMRGRRWALLNCLFLQAFVDSLSAVSSNYWAFAGLKFFTGLSLSGQTAMVFTYVGEFQPTKYRKVVLAAMEIPGIMGLVVPSVVAWLIIPLDIEFTYSYFSFKSWNLFVILMSALPALLFGCVLLTMPETPKYLAATGRTVELRNVLTKMYCQNTGNEAVNYIEKFDKNGIIHFASVIDEYNSKTSVTVLRRMSIMFQTLYAQTKTLVKQPYIGRTLMSYTANCILASVFTVTLWFPEMFQRLTDYENRHPGESVDICVVSDMNAQENNQNLSISTNQTEASKHLGLSDCVATIDDRVYLDSLILGLSCIPATIIFILIVSRFGFRFFLVIASLVPCAVIFSLSFVHTSMEILILSCIWEALSSVGLTAIYCLLVEIYPTDLRITASALSSILNRLSVFIGNIIFGYLLDSHCVALFTLMSVELFVCGVLCAFIPNDDNVKPIIKQQTTEDISEMKNDLTIDNENPIPKPKSDRSIADE